MDRYDRLGDLPVRIDGYDLDLHERDTSSDFTRTTTVVSLHGAGEIGRGEDVTYENDDHYALVEGDHEFALAGEHTHSSFSDALGDIDLFPAGAPDREVFRNYRRWGFESAALDLALKQADTDLASALDTQYRPVRFLASTRLGDPPTIDRVETLLDRNPDIEFKLDPTPEWSADLVADLAATDQVRIADLKGHYEGTEVDAAPDPDLYERIVEGFPEAIVEDPALTDETEDLFAGQEGRLSWDAPIHGVGDVEAIPVEPSWLNVKPSRFGSAASLFETIDFCEENDITMYGGGQFELDVGREHLHAIASVCYPDGPNDIAPGGYNDPEPPENLPTSPLEPPADARGLEWRSPTVE